MFQKSEDSHNIKNVFNLAINYKMLLKVELIKYILKF